MTNGSESYDPLEEVEGILRGEGVEESREFEVILPYATVQLTARFVSAMIGSFREEKVETQHQEVSTTLDAMIHDENAYRLLEEKLRKSLEETAYGFQVVVPLNSTDVTVIFFAQASAVSLLKGEVDIITCMNTMSEIRKAFVNAGGQTQVPDMGLGNIEER